MATNNNNTKLCSICGARNWLISCFGCQQSFCCNHLPQHRALLSRELNNIDEQYQNLRRIYEQHEKFQEHPLFSAIDVWQHEAIMRIHETAERVRHDLQQIHDESNIRMKNILNEFNETLLKEREQDGYTEIEIKQLQEQLIHMRKQLETPCDIELVEDNDLPPIHFVKIRAIIPNRLSSIASTTDSQLCDDDEVDLNKCMPCDTDELINTQPTTVHNNEESFVDCTEPTEEAKAYASTCTTLSTESQHLLDPTKQQDLLILQLPSTTRSFVSEIYNQLTNHHLQIFHEQEIFISQLDICEQAITFINTSDMSPNDQFCLLDKISEINNVYYIYIHGRPFEDDEKRKEFFLRYPKIKAMFESEQRLMVQWAMDTVNEYKLTGDFYVELGDQDKARQCFQSGIDLYENLSKFFNEKRRVR